MEQERRTHRVVDLASHINETIERGHPADFPVSLKPVFHDSDGIYTPIPKRLAVVREDNGQAISVVSNRYTLIPHQRILDMIEKAIRPLDLGPVPRGIYVDRQGARMRAIFKFPDLAQPVVQGDEICPCLKIQNTYDGTSRIAVHIGAFRFVCTNLAVGGGGAFAGGFMSIHAGQIPLDEVAKQVTAYLASFDKILVMYRCWMDQWLLQGSLAKVLEGVAPWHVKRIGEAYASSKPTVYEAYNAATYYATHHMRSYRTAFDLLERINRGFQKAFPPLPESDPEPMVDAHQATAPGADAPDVKPTHAAA